MSKLSFVIGYCSDYIIRLPAFKLMYIICVTVFVGPDVESPSSSEPCAGSGAEEDRELYLMCLCEQQVTSVDGSKKKKGKEIVIGFLVS